MFRLLIPLLFFLLHSLCLADTARHGLSLYGPVGLKYRAGQPYGYANPRAPKGGTLRLSSVGSFTKLNPFTLKGVPAPGLGLVFESLMDASEDPEEVFSEYGLLAQHVAIAPDRMSITYTLQPNARFSDGTPMTADDVVFSFNLVHDPEFAPFYKMYFADVFKAAKMSPRAVKFYFKKYNQELPLIVGQLKILPRHIYGAPGKKFGSDFDDRIPVGSGPYLVASYDKSKIITYRRNPDYWGKGLAVNQGRYNFDTIAFKIFLDPITEREALKAGQIDANQISSSREWALEYNGRDVKKGRLKKALFPHERVSGMQCYAFNLRRPLFQDVQIRKAISAAFDFDWMNENLFYGQYRRQMCFFDNNKELMSHGPAQGTERAELTALQKKYNRQGHIAVPTEAITVGPFNIGDYPRTVPLETRIKLTNEFLDKKGWRFDPLKKVRVKGAQTLRFTILLDSPQWVRIVTPFIETLRRIGVQAEYQLVQPAEYAARLESFDFDMVVAVFGQSRSPGNEQRDMWSSRSADIRGSRNLIGIKNPAIDDVIDNLVRADERRTLVKYVHELDRILCANFYVIPHWYLNADRAVYWDKFAQPKKMASSAGFLSNIMNWWWIR